MALARFKDLCLDAADPLVLGRFWTGALELDLHVLDDGDVVLRGPTPEHTVWVNAVPEPRTAKARLHLDLDVGSVQSLLDLGASVLDTDQPRWTVLADPEGTEFCAFVRPGLTHRRVYEIGVDVTGTAEDAHRAAQWWAGVLGSEVRDDPTGYSSVAPVPGAPFDSIDFAPVPEPKTAKNRVHLDVTTDSLDGLLDAGARALLPAADGRAWTVLADPEGNEFCAFPTPT